MGVTPTLLDNPAAPVCTIVLSFPEIPPSPACVPSQCISIRRRSVDLVPLIPRFEKLTFTCVAANQASRSPPQENALPFPVMMNTQISGSASAQSMNVDRFFESSVQNVFNLLVDSCVVDWG